MELQSLACGGLVLLHQTTQRIDLTKSREPARNLTVSCVSDRWKANYLKSSLSTSLSLFVSCPIAQNTMANYRTPIDFYQKEALLVTLLFG